MLIQIGMCLHRKGSEVASCLADREEPRGWGKGAGSWLVCCLKPPGCSEAWLSESRWSTNRRAPYFCKFLLRFWVKLKMHIIKPHSSIHWPWALTRYLGGLTVLPSCYRTWVCRQKVWGTEEEVPLDVALSSGVTKLICANTGISLSLGKSLRVGN